MCAAILAGASLALPGVALGSERSLEDAPPPNTTSDIQTDIERVFPRLRSRSVLFPGLSATLRGRFPRFFAESHVEARLRTYYLRKDRTTDILSEGWAAGGSISFRSGWLADALAFEVEGFTSQRVDAPRDRDGTLLLTPGPGGLTTLGIANAKLRHRGLLLTGYRQYLDLPYVNRRDNRMIPNTFESLTLAKREGAVRFSAGYTWKVKLRDSNHFESMTAALGLPKDRGLAHAGVVWDPDAGLRVGAVAIGVPDLFATVYGEFSLERELARGWGTRLDAQATYQADVGDDLLGEGLDDAWNLGLRASASRAGAVFKVGLVVTGPSAGLTSLYGSNPSYVDLMQRTFANEDEKALLLSASYDFAGVGAPGFSVIVNAVAGFDGVELGVRRDAQEVDLTLDYRTEKGLLKNFWLRLRGAWLHEQGTASDGVEARLIIRYDLPVI